MAVLKDLNQRMNQTILVITHDNEVASYGDRILHMRDGRVEAECGYDVSVDGKSRMLPS